MDCIGLVVNPGKPDAFPLGAQLAERARAASCRVLIESPAPFPCPAEEVPLPELVARSDLLLILGGDGSLLRVAREAAPAGKPMLGIHFGHYGFIMETEPGEALQALERVLEGRFTLSRRMMLQTELVRRGKAAGTHLALNDVVVGRGELSRLLRMSVVVGSHEVVRYSADGLIIATPTGSTAYSLSAGGPVVHPELDVVTLTPIAPHTLSARALVIPAGEEIRVSAGDPGISTVTVDGQHFERLGEGDVVRIVRAPVTADLVQISSTAFYKQLDSRLGFGERFER